jgi:glycosyltransferase involved in cell wall biosynthesis
LPIVTEEGNHPPEIAYLKPGRNGFMVPANDLAALRARIFELLDNDALRAQFSRDARHDIMAEASTEAMFKGFLDCARFLQEDRRGHASSEFPLMASVKPDGLPRP